eukprot:TRINITY_DN2660_c0_g1_i1.p1 TRINITY_DN2660_c0_g1~~TRINITY_DN2660_c0_g1_i1.p1  ORF type:complete len:405 (-),score=33.85 TRINITY_DN2660_c0_g1_i1:282-1496(-)
MCVSGEALQTIISDCSTSSDHWASSGVESTGTSTSVSSRTGSSSSPSPAFYTSSSEPSGDGGDTAPHGIAMFLQETREHMLDLLEEGYPSSDVADIVGCSERTMRRWIQHFQTNGTVWSHPRLQNHHDDAVIRNTLLARAILTLVETEPAASLRYHVDVLVALSLDHPTSDHRWVSAATVYRELRYHGYRRMKIERLYAESSEAAQRAFAVLIDELPMRCLISCDETHTAGSDILRRFGRSRRSAPCVLRDRDTRPMKRTSTMMGVTLTHGVLWSQTVIVGSAQTSDDGRLFLQCLRTRMNTYVPGLPSAMQPDACVVLYDNSSFDDHWGDEYTQANGMHYVRLPPYSPSLQPMRFRRAQEAREIPRLRVRAIYGQALLPYGRRRRHADYCPGGRPVFPCVPRD